MNLSNVNMHRLEEHQGDSKLAQQMARKIRIACWVMTQPDNHEHKAKHVKATWGQHCNVIVFMSTKEGKINVMLRRHSKLEK